MLQGHAFVGLEGQLAGVELDAVAALGLGPVHGRVGVLHQGSDVLAVHREQADADAGADEEFLVVGDEGVAEAVQQFFRHVLGVGALVQAGQQDDEFVAALACDGVDIAQLFAQAPGDGFQQLVADRVAEAVVDVLEAVQVEEQHGAQLLFFLAFLQGGGQARFEQQAVGQAGERVVVGLVVEAGLGVLERGDVGEDADEVAGFAVVAPHGADGQPLRVEFAALAPVPDFALPMAFGVEVVPHGDVEAAVVLPRGQQAR